MVDERVQELVSTYTVTNWANHRTATQGGYPFGRPNQQPGMVSSFGAATLAVGRERFRVWATDLLARTAIAGLIEGHENSDQFPGLDDALTEHDRKEVLAKKYSRTLFDADGRTASKPDGRASDRLAGIYDEILGHSDASKIEQEFLEPLRSIEELSCVEWKHQINDQLREQWETVEEDGTSRSINYDKLNSWADRFVQGVCEDVSEIIADSSIPVAIGALKGAQGAATKFADSRQDKVANNYNDRETKYFDALATLEASRRKKLKASHPDCEGALSAAVMYLEALWNERRYWSIKEIVDSARSFVYGELIGILTKQHRVLEEVLKKDPVKSWPRDVDQRPTFYLPGPLEVTLESADLWPSLLDKLCQELRRGESWSRPIDAARRILIEGDPEGQVDLPAVLRHTSNNMRWIPQDERKVTFTSEFDSDSIVRRTRTLLASRVFDKTIGEGLSQYLSPEHEDHSARLSEFKTCLDAALNLSLPLVRLDSDLCRVLYDDKAGPDAVERVCSAFPFGLKHPAYGVTQALLGEAYNQIQAGDATSVTISSVMAYPLHPMVIESLMSPIATAVQSCRTASTLQTNFWLWRRARTLPWFVPVSSDMRRAMIRGFAIGRMCGHITASTKHATKISGTPVTKKGPEVVTFPWPMLSVVHDALELLPALLESFVLCFARVGSGHQSAFEPYARLHNMGNDLLEGEKSVVRKLIVAGSAPGPQVDEPKIGGADEQQRQAAAEEYLQTQIDFFIGLEREPFIGDEFCNTEGNNPQDNPATGEPLKYVIVRELLPEMRECFEDVLNMLKKANRPKRTSI